MRCQSTVLDPCPQAERGTLEYAASTLFCEQGVLLEMSREEAAQLLASLAGVIPQTHSIIFFRVCDLLREELR